MQNKYIFILLSAIFISTGTLTILLPKPYFVPSLFIHDFGIDLTSVRWIAGPGLILLGLLFFNKALKIPLYKMVGYKCIQCGKVFRLDSLTKSKCKNCGSPLEELVGFFERHPEFDREKADRGNDLK